MANWNTQTKKHNIVIEAPHDVSNPVKFHDCIWKHLAEWADKSAYSYFGIIHDSDVDEDGVKKRVHSHLVLLTPHRVRIGTMVNRIADLLHIPQEAVSDIAFESTAGAVQYLIHKNNPDKFQYDYTEVKTNHQVDLVALLAQDLRSEITTEYLLDLIDGGMSRRDIARYIGLGNYLAYRNAINDFMRSE